MSYTKRYIESLQEQGIDPFASEAIDAEYDAEYMEFLREQERDRLMEEYAEAEKEAKEKGMFNEHVTVRKSDEVMPVLRTKVESKEKV